MAASLVIAANALLVATAGTAAPVIAAAAGATISSAAAATLTSAALTVATTALVTGATVAATALVVDVATVVSEQTNPKEKTYTVYFLEDSNGTVQYVGRVTDEGFQTRMNHHLHTRGLTPAYYTSGLTYCEARGLEEIGMIECHTINSLNPQNNQIHGVSDRNKRGEQYLSAAMEYISNRAENRLLNLLY